jgi:ornithine cyclodeaminase/alanine dehydrogenase-like protein (mu-crystallin family)
MLSTDFATNVMMAVSMLQERRHRVLDSNHIHEIRTSVAQLCAQEDYSQKDPRVIPICGAGLEGTAVLGAVPGP